MNTRVTAILVVLFGLIVAYMVFKGDGGTTAEQEETTVSKNLIEVKSSEIAKLEIVSGGKTLQLQSTDGKWRITQPIESNADVYEVETLISRAVLVSGDSQSAVADFAPVAVLRLESASGKKHTLEFGQTTATGAVFVRVDAGGSDGGRFAVVADASTTGVEELQDVDGLLAKLRSRELVSVRSNEISAIAMSGGGGPEVELRHTEAGWRVLKPYEAAADEGTISNLLLTASGLRAVSFPKSPATIDANGRRVVFTLDSAPATTVPSASAAKPRTVELVLGGFEDIRRVNRLVQVTVDGKTTVATMAHATAEALAVDVLSLRSREVLRVPADATRLEIAPQAVPLNPEPTMVVLGGEQSTAVTDLVSVFRPLRAAKYVGAVPSGMAKYRVSFGEGKERQDIDVWVTSPAGTEDSSPPSVVGAYNGLVFELPASVASLIEQVLTPPASPATAPAGQP